MRREFPAAGRSGMYWFGVDGEGRLAVFQTGEFGALPSASPFEPGQEHEVFERLEAIQVVRAHLLGTLAVSEDLENLAVDDRCLVLFEPDSAVEDLTRAQGVEVLEVSSRRFAATEPNTPIALRVSKIGARLRDKIRIADGYIGSWRFNDWELEELAPDLGLHYYGHDPDGAGPGAYRRIAEPDEQRELRVEILPIELRKQLERVQMVRVRFAHTVALHLADHQVEAVTRRGEPLRSPTGNAEGGGATMPQSEGDPYRTEQSSETPPRKHEPRRPAARRTFILLGVLVALGLLLAWLAR